MNAQVDTVKIASDTTLQSTSTQKPKGKKTQIADLQDGEKVVLTDSILRKMHNPKLAIGLSAAFPGAGQIYNKKWWKLPIIYAGIGVTVYLIADYATKTRKYSREYNNRVNTGVVNPDLDMYDTNSILSLKNYYRRNMEISIAACAIVYVLNILDAAVDAHLFYFDVSDNLSMSILPYTNTNPFSGSLHTGLAFTLKF